MLLRKMLRDMRLKSSQFLSIFLMAFLGVGVFAGINAEWVGLQSVTDAYFADTNQADLWLTGERLTEADREAALAVPGVTGVQLRLSLQGTAELPHKPMLDIHVLDTYAISTLRVTEGAAYDGGLDGVWLDRDFASANALRVGDTLAFSASGITVRCEILGLVISPEYLTIATGGGDLVPDHRMTGFVYAPRRVLPAWAPVFHTSLLVTTDHAQDTAARVEAALAGRFILLLTRETYPALSLWASEIAQHKAMGEVFPLAFLAVALLTILTTMTRLVAGQRTQIGVLKALGFRRAVILRHYVGYGLFLSLLGAAAGLLVAPSLLPPLLFSMNRSIFVLPAWQAALSPAIFVMAAATVALCTGVTYLAVRGELKPVPAEALRPKAPRPIRRTALEQTRLWRRLGFNAQWNLRDILRNRLRSLMAVVGVAGCVMLLLCALGLRDTLNGWVTWQYDEINLFHAKLLLADDCAPETARQLAVDIGGTLMTETAADLRHGDRRASGTLTVTDSTALWRVPDAQSGTLALPERGVAISRKMAALLGAAVGDTLRWKAYGDSVWHEADIAAVYLSPIGQGILFSQAAMDALGIPIRPTAILSPSAAEGVPDGVKTVLTKTSLRASNETFLASMDLLVGILLLAAVLLAVVVLYNLGVLAYVERERDLATLKVIGFRTRRIRALLFWQNTALTALGIAAGLPLGRWLIGFILDTLSDTMDMDAILTPVSLLLSIVGTFCVSAPVCLALSRKVRHLDMISALKAVE